MEVLLFPRTERRGFTLLMKGSLHSAVFVDGNCLFLCHRHVLEPLCRSVLPFHQNSPMPLVPFAGLLRGSSAGAGCREEERGLHQQLGSWPLAFSCAHLLQEGFLVPGFEMLLECSSYSVVFQDTGSCLTQHPALLHPQQRDGAERE